MTPAVLGVGVLWALALAVPVLLALGAAGAAWPARARLVFMVIAVLGGVLLPFVLGVAVLGVPVEIALPLGPPGLGTRLRLDPRGCMSLLALLLPAVAAAVAALDAPDEGAAARFAALLGLGVLALVAASPFLVTGAVAGIVVLLVGTRAWPAPLVALATAGLALAVLPNVVLGLPPRGAAEGILPSWMGGVVLGAGALGALAAGWRACRLDSLMAVPVALAGVHLGVMASGMGLALLARAADLTPLAAGALAAVQLHSLNAAVVTGLMVLAAGVLARGAGTGALDRLGGLIQPMAVSGGCMLAGGWACLMVPPSPVFASAWLLFQALFGAPRAGGVALGALLGMVAAVLAGALALAGVAVLRLFGVALLGRPRTPRAAAAQEAGKPARAALLGLAACAVVLGVLPGLATGLVAQGLAGGVLVLRPTVEGGGYVAPAIAALLLPAIGLSWRLLRRRAAGGQQWGAAWNGGFAAPPPWLPFGEPEAQMNATALAQAVAPSWTSARPDWRGLAARARAFLAGAVPSDFAWLGATLVLALLTVLLVTLAVA